MIVSALDGATAMACLAIGLVFLKHWRASGDRLLLAFAAAFAILCVEYIVLGVAAFGAEWQPYVYSVRLLAFGVLIWGVVDKNRQRR
jgi:hypothetical protein